MKILVLSDSHRAQQPMLDAVRREHPDAIIHLGDHASDTQALSAAFPLLPLCTVRGNCDLYEDSVPESALMNWEGVRIFAVHGHRYGVKSGVLRLYYAAMEKKATVILYGHTHIPYCEESDGIWLMNPGSCGYSHPSYGIIEIKNGIPYCHIEELYKEGKK